MPQCPKCLENMSLSGNHYVCICGYSELQDSVLMKDKEKEKVKSRYLKMIDDYYKIETEIETSSKIETEEIIEVLVSQITDAVNKENATKLEEIQELLSQATDKLLLHKDVTVELENKLTNTQFSTLQEKLDFLNKHEEFPLAGLLIRNAIEDTLKNKIKIPTFTKEMKKAYPNYDLKVNDYITKFTRNLATKYHNEFSIMERRNRLRKYDIDGADYVRTIVIMRFGTALGKLEHKSSEPGIKNYDIAKKIKNDVWNTINLLVHFDSDMNKQIINRKFPNKGDLAKFLHNTLSYLKDLKLIQE